MEITSKTEVQSGFIHQWYKGWETVQTYFSNPFRDKWNRKLEFILTCLGYCIGFGNIWRFPYIVHKNGGGAFFLPYVLVLLVMALPIFYLEALLGQFTSCSVISAFNFAPACKGVGFSTLMVCIYASIYYIMFMVYASIYFFQSFTYELPWKHCRAEWGAAKNCFDRDQITYRTESGKKRLTNLTTPTEEYWQVAILHVKENQVKYNIDNLGSIQWPLFGMLLFSWVLQYIFLIRGIRISGKVWRAATTQSFYSTGIAYGCIILYSSYNDFQYPVQSIAITIVAFDLFASFCSSMTVFSVLGYLAKTLNVDITEVVDQGPGLIFVVMPEAIANMPASHVWSVLYFLMLYCVGIDSQAAMVENLITTAYEEIPKLKKHKGKVRIIVCLTLFLLGIPTTTNGGIYVINFIDTFSADFTLPTIALCELLSVIYIYGYRKFICDIHFMTGRKVNIYWLTCWLAIVPVLLLIILGSSLFQTSICGAFSTSYCIAGWFLACSSLISIPIFAITYSCMFCHKGVKCKYAFLPTYEWGPRDPINKLLYLEWQNHKGKIVDENTAEMLDELKYEVTDEFPTVEAVIKNRVLHKRVSIFRRFSKNFRAHELEILESGEQVH